MKDLPKHSLTIAVDFDGTIVEDRYPAIGKPRMFAFDTIHQLQQAGHRIILWTYREGDALKAAVDFCRQKGLEFYAVNKSHPEETAPYATRKILADYFIDDRNIQGIPEWGVIGQQLLHADLPTRTSNKSFFSNLINRLFK